MTSPVSDSAPGERRTPELLGDYAGGDRGQGEVLIWDATQQAAKPGR